MNIEKIQKASDTIKSHFTTVPELGFVLGSGLGVFTDHMTDKEELFYHSIPYFHTTSVVGHAGKLVKGKIGNTEIIVMNGRLHPYEGHELEDVVLPIRALGISGVKKLILTNASGGINLEYQPGDLSIITDHMNFSGKNPLLGPNEDQLGKRFPDMGEAYSKKLISCFEKCAKKIDLNLHKGVYACVLGPSYETPAEIRMLKTLGADMVGMSTVPEVIAAHHMGIKVGAISCITNHAAGLKDEVLSHDDVKEVANKAVDRFSKLIEEIIQELGENS